MEPHTREYLDIFELESRKPIWSFITVLFNWLRNIYGKIISSKKSDDKEENRLHNHYLFITIQRIIPVENVKKLTRN